MVDRAHGLRGITTLVQMPGEGFPEPGVLRKSPQRLLRYLQGLDGFSGNLERVDQLLARPVIVRFLCLTSSTTS